MFHRSVLYLNIVDYQYHIRLTLIIRLFLFMLKRCWLHNMITGLLRCICVNDMVIGRVMFKFSIFFFTKQYLDIDSRLGISVMPQQRGMSSLFKL